MYLFPYFIYVHNLNRCKKCKTLREGTRWKHSKYSLQELLRLSYEFCKGNHNQSIKVCETQDMCYKSTIEQRKKFRETLTEHNLRSDVDIGDHIVMDETMTMGQKSKRGGRQHAKHSVWTNIYANKAAGNRKIRIYN